MGIQINGVTDSISAVDGSLSLTGAELASVGGINVSGVVTATTYIVGSGSTSAPSISPSGDSNTGIFFPSADTIAFGEGGAEVARFDSSGRFSIGTTSPSQPFVVSNGGAAGLEIDPNGVDSGSTIQGYNRSTSAFVPVTMLGSHLAFRSGSSPTERARIDTSGRFGIGTTAPIAQTHIMLSDVTGYTSPSNDGFVLERGGGNDVAISIATDNTRNGYLIFADGDSANPAWVGYDHSVNAMSFRVNASERARIDSSGRLLVGTSTARSNFFNTTSLSGNLQLEGSADTSRLISHVYSQNSADDPFLVFGKTRSTTIGGNTIVQSGDYLGGIAFQGADGTELVSAAEIRAVVDGTPGANDMPGLLLFSTTADGASSPTERFRIASSGAFGLSGVNYGSSGQMLTSNGSGSAPTWQSPINRGTAVASTSGTAIDFTSIPSWARRITVMLSAVSTNGTSNLLLQIGDSGGIETSGYVGSVDVWAATPGATLFGGTGFNLDNTATAAAVRHYVATVVNINGNTWVYTLTGARSNSAGIALAGGSKTLSDVLDRVRVTATNGTDSFDAGTINIFYEG